MDKIQFIQTSPNELAELIDGRLKKSLKQLEKKIVAKDASDEIVTPDELCRIFKIDRSTEWRWQRSGKIQAYGIGGRRYYLLSELLEALQLVKK